MTGSYSTGMVLLSIFVAMIASFTALDLTRRIVNIKDLLMRQIWLIGGAISMGIGIWSMHFIGMLAFSMPVPLGYDIWITLLSLGIAVIVSWFALYMATRKSMAIDHLIIAGILMGFGISAMHYTGMEAMKMSPGIQYTPWIFIASILVAITASIAAMWIAFTLRREQQSYFFLKNIGAAMVMGFAITGMHYTGMAAAKFHPLCVSLASQTDNLWLTISITGVTIAILAITLILSFLDTRMESRTRALNKLLKSADDQLMHMATHDTLTNLPNRMVLIEQIQHAIHISERSGLPFAVMYIDLDGFKMVNDSLGHQFGDSLLLAVTERLQSILRKEDTLSRIGGDEFVVLVENLIETDNAMTICEQINKAMEDSFQADKAELHITTSIGIAIYPSDGDSVDTLLHNADAAMYEVKRSGRNGYRYFEPAMNSNALRVLRIQGDLRKAFSNGELYMHYQPKFLGDGMNLAGAEALIRWKHPTLGQISPGEFIPIAERSGLIIEVGEWVVHQVAQQLLQWNKQGISPVKIAVNLSAKHLRQHNLAEHLIEILHSYGLTTDCLMLEITESAAMEDAETNVATINALQESGFDVAIDDFGTGYSSLSYLQQFRVRQLKIDRFFVDGLDKNSCEGAAIVSAVIALAHALGMEVVAEGVETDSQLNELQRLSCDQYQGYLLDKPMSASDFTTLLIAAKENKSSTACDVEKTVTASTAGTSTS